MAWEVELDPCRQCREEGKSEWRIIGLTPGYHGMLGDEAQARRVSMALQATEGIPTDKLAEGLVVKLRDALEQIAKGEGAFSRDPLKHAENVIEEAKATALDALASAKTPA